MVRPAFLSCLPVILRLRLKHFRVDKMTDISYLDRPRDGKEAFAGIDMSEYSKKTFGMFTGTEELVRLKFANYLVGAVIDRFGSDTMIVAAGDGHFTVSVNAVVSPQFFAWLFGFGKEVEIVYPAALREEMKKAALEIAEMY